MRLLALLLLAGAAFSAESRAWRGVIAVRSIGRAPLEGKGSETQEERIEFVLVYQPSTTKGVPVPFRMRKATGSYTLSVNKTDRGVTTSGKGNGKLFPTIAGLVQQGYGMVTEFSF